MSDLSTQILRTVSEAGGSLTLREIIDKVKEAMPTTRYYVGAAVFDMNNWTGELKCRNNSQRIFEQIFDLSAKGRKHLEAFDG